MGCGPDRGALSPLSRKWGHLVTPSPDRLLGPKPVVQTTATLGRVFNVTCETWRLSDDPRATAPARELVATARTASEAADLARDAALRCPRNGFHRSEERRV